jgi:hypothetical protein
MCYGRAVQSPPPSRRYGASAPSPPPARRYAAGRNDQREDEAETGFMRGMVNIFTALTNQVVRISGGWGRNQGWPYFDRTFKEYPAFKRKFRTYQDNYHRLTPQRELVQMFREMCLPERVAARIRRAESMPVAWAILDTFYNDPVQFARDLMQDIQAVQKIRENEFEKLLEYYILLQGHIAEGDKADQGDMLLIPANIEEMVQALPLREEMLWREEQANVHPRDYGYSFHYLWMQG